MLWNNKFICVEKKKSVFSKNLNDYGIYKVGDLYDVAGEMKIGKEPLLSAISPALIISCYTVFSVHFHKHSKQATHCEHTAKDKLNIRRLLGFAVNEIISVG